MPSASAAAQTLATNLDSDGPVCVEVTRGGIVESRHHGSVAVVDVEGGVRLACGDIKSPIFPRSAIKGLQAIAVVESGAADAVNFSDDELALICASHNGEQRHVNAALGVLARQGLGEPDLECGAHWPYYEPMTRAMAAKGVEPTQLHNNCSGKHTGMLSLAKAIGAPTKGYTAVTHPVQQRIMGVLETMTGYDLSDAVWDRDGCSVPNWAIPLENLAYGFARFGTGEALSQERAEACARIRSAVHAAPFMVAGTGRYCTEVMTILGSKAFLKTGAEGVFCAALPEMGLGVALKCSDGAKRGAEVMITAVLDALGVIDDADRPAMDAFLTPPVTNWNGFRTGELRPAAGFPSF
ncbi:MAG: asparaginase [Alphaproteobacteria bacterium]|nr:asparaginase [Alphaproteobacteria bacterium]